ncbi:hypothetical protein QJQ45_027850 [Haematococcus lacustris]|nr:hypothetical protein QJQ45_027850 [Haematococcus lacustris]
MGLSSSPVSSWRLRDMRGPGCRGAPQDQLNDKARWQFWAEDTKSMEGYVQEHSSGKTLAAVLHDPANKVIMDGSSSTFAFYWSAGLRAHQAFQRTMVPCWGECSEASKGNVTLRSQCMDRTCHPKALAADQEVARGLGVAYDTLHLPLIMSAVYGSWQPRMVVLLRNPIDRLYCAYWLHPHYKSKYGDSAEGFLAYVKEQVAALRSCSARFVGQPGGPAGLPMTPRQAERHCALYFEALGSHEEQIFFHADQIIRGMYSIFLEVWLRHFQRSSMLVLKSEEYFRAPAATVDKVDGLAQGDQCGPGYGGGVLVMMQATGAVFAFLGLTKPSDPGVVASAARPDLSTAQVDAVVAEVNKRMAMGSKQCVLAAVLLVEGMKWVSRQHYNRERGVAVFLGSGNFSQGGWKGGAHCQVNQRLVGPAWSQQYANYVRGLSWCHQVPPDPPPPPPAQAQPLPAAPGPVPRPKAPPWGRWLDRDTNGCLNLQRIGESMQRPLELCSYEGLEAQPPVGEEYQQGYKLVNDRLPKGRQRLHRAAKYRGVLMDGPATMHRAWKFGQADSLTKASRWTMDESGAQGSRPGIHRADQRKPQAARPDLSTAQVDAVVAEVNKRMTMGSKQCALAAVLGLFLTIWDPQLLAQIRDAMELLTKVSVLEHLMRGPHHRGIGLLPDYSLPDREHKWRLPPNSVLRQPSKLQNSGWEFVQRVETDGVNISVHFVKEPVELPFIGRQITSYFNPKTHIAVGVDLGVKQAIKVGHAQRDPATGQLLRKWQWELTKGQLKHDSGLTKAKQDTARWSAAIQPQLQQLAAATPAGTTLNGLHAHILALKVTWDALWEEYLKPRWRRQRLRLHHAQDHVIEAFCKKAPPPTPPAQAQPLPAAPGPVLRSLAPPWGRWLDRDTNGKDLEALPPIGKEYQQGYKLVNDRLPKGRQRLHRAAEYRRGIDGWARNNA